MRLQGERAYRIRNRYFFGPPMQVPHHYVYWRFQMVIKILGTGCPKCRKLEANVREALMQSNVSGEVEKVTNLNDIMEYGVVMTPGLVIDEKVRASGKALSVEQIKRILTEES
jgi:small redox-active disulfide protein 2